MPRPIADYNIPVSVLGSALR